MFGFRRIDRLIAAVERLGDDINSLRDTVAAQNGDPEAGAEERESLEQGLPDGVLGGLVTLGGLYVAANAFISNTQLLRLRLTIACAAGLLAVLYLWAFWKGWRAPSGSKLRPGTVAVVGIMVALTGVLQFDGWRDAHRAAANVAEIREVITKSNDMTLEWYKQPDKQPEIGEYFLPPEQGGDRLPAIECVVAYLETNSLKYADSATANEFFKQVLLSPDHRTATVETSEMWYSPLAVLRDGQEILLDLSPEQLNQYSVQQFYVLRKIDGDWLILSNPVPLSPAVGC